jgi:hypothetical protein
MEMESEGSRAVCLFGPGTQQIKKSTSRLQLAEGGRLCGSLVPLVEAAKQIQKNKAGDAAVDLDTARKRNLKTTPSSPNQRSQNNTEGGRFWGVGSWVGLTVSLLMYRCTYTTCTDGQMYIVR